jgi:hypothetical protein
MKATLEYNDHWHALRLSSRRLRIVITALPFRFWEDRRIWAYSTESFGWWGGRVFGPVTVLVPCESMKASIL